MVPARRVLVPAKPLRILHIAPEPHLGTRLAALPDVEYVSGDIRKGMGQVRFDICDLPFDDGSFDLICCVHVLMMLPDDAPATAEERRRLFNDDTILRLYGDDYRSRLSAAGFVVEDARPAAGIALAKRERMELYSGEVILSLKPGRTR